MSLTNIAITTFSKSMKKTTKDRICATCKLKKTCGDVPGLCVLLHYSLIAFIVFGLLYMLVTMTL